MHLQKPWLLVVLLTSSTALATRADNITVHNTGVDSSDALVASGAATAFWSLSAQPSGAGYAAGSNPFRYHHPSYAADLPNAAWVSPSSSGIAGAGGFYTYSLAIDLTGLDPSTASITGRFSTDNDGSIGVNGGTAASLVFEEFRSLHAFSLTSGFHAGINTIDLTVNNGGDPTAFLVVFDSATARRTVTGVPDTDSSLLLAAGALLPVLAWARRRG